MARLYFDGILRTSKSKPDVKDSDSIGPRDWFYGDSTLATLDVKSAVLSQTLWGPEKPTPKSQNAVLSESFRPASCESP